MKLPKSFGLTRDPVGHSLRLGIRKAGERLFEIFGTARAMGEVLDEVCGDNMIWTNILDKRWDGIGRGNDRWWA